MVDQNTYISALSLPLQLFSNGGFKIRAKHLLLASYGNPCQKVKNVIISETLTHDLISTPAISMECIHKHSHL